MSAEPTHAFVASADVRLCARSVGTATAAREQPRCLGTALAVALQLLAAGMQGGGGVDPYGSDPQPFTPACRPSRVLLITTGPATKVLLLPPTHSPSPYCATPPSPPPFPLSHARPHCSWHVKTHPEVILCAGVLSAAVHYCLLVYNFCLFACVFMHMLLCCNLAYMSVCLSASLSLLSDCLHECWLDTISPGVA